MSSSILLFFLCAITDVSFFAAGYGYRYFVYESLLCIIFFPNRYLNALLFSSILLLKILFIFFSINIFSLGWLILERSVIYVSVVACSVTVLYFANYKSLLYFMIALTAIVFFDKQIFRDQFATSILYTSYHAAIVRPATPIDSSVHEALRESLLNGPTILINWESLGVPRDFQVVQKLQERHPNLNYNEVKILPRSTISSEFEYLCGRSFGRLNEQAICLPHRQSSIALHGNFGYFFNRKNTYKAFGFKIFNFMNSIPGETCFYSFRGKCDRAVFDNVIKLARAKSADFIYVLTLDSHFPYVKYESHGKELWNEIDDFLTIFQNSALGYNLIIVGDHPPPLASEFYGDRVPLIYMKM